MSTASGRNARRRRDLGFDGKTLIHPGQIEACNAIFTPPAEEVAQARKIIAAFERPENASRGAIQLDGQMVERLHADMARRTIAIADCDRGDGIELVPSAGEGRITRAQTAPPPTHTGCRNRPLLPRPFGEM